MIEYRGKCVVKRGTKTVMYTSRNNIFWVEGYDFIQVAPQIIIVYSVPLGYLP